MKVTEALTVEHAMLRDLFKQIERMCSDIDTVLEIHLLARMMERLLGRHESKEAHLLYVADPHTTEDRCQLNGMSLEHDELDRLFREVQGAHTVTETRRLLRRALSRATRHFHYEELNVFPTIERSLEPETGKELTQCADFGLSPVHENTSPPACCKAPEPRPGQAGWSNQSLPSPRHRSQCPPKHTRQIHLKRIGQPQKCIEGWVLQSRFPVAHYLL